jgi:hypothetical protein
MHADEVGRTHWKSDATHYMGYYQYPPPAWADWDLDVTRASGRLRDEEWNRWEPTGCVCEWKASAGYRLGGWIVCAYCGRLVGLASLDEQRAHPRSRANLRLAVDPTARVR